ncbi:MAG: hypothetical protein JST30_14980 [Armatimonadetes bacterium]|nr:hypothetical protein [Armatimonadota bacterium]
MVLQWHVRILAASSTLVFCASAVAQPSERWSTFVDSGTRTDDIPYSVIETADRGFLGVVGVDSRGRIVRWNGEGAVLTSRAVKASSGSTLYRHSDDTVYLCRDNVIERVDSWGKPLWTRYVGFLEKDGSANSILLGSGSILAGGSKPVKRTRSTGTTRPDSALSLVRSDGTIAWEWSAAVAGLKGSSVSNLVEDEGGGIYVLRGAGTGLSALLDLVRLDADGHVSWVKPLDESKRVNLAPHPGGGVYVVERSTTAVPAPVLIRYVDSMGGLAGTMVLGDSLAATDTFGSTAGPDGALYCTRQPPFSSRLSLSKVSPDLRSAWTREVPGYHYNFGPPLMTRTSDGRLAIGSNAVLDAQRVCSCIVFDLDGGLDWTSVLSAPIRDYRDIRLRADRDGSLLQSFGAKGLLADTDVFVTKLGPNGERLAGFVSNVMLGGTEKSMQAHRLLDGSFLLVNDAGRTDLMVRGGIALVDSVGRTTWSRPLLGTVPGQVRSTTVRTEPEGGIVVAGEVFGRRFDGTGVAGPYMVRYGPDAGQEWVWLAGGTSQGSVKDFVVLPDGAVAGTAQYAYGNGRYDRFRFTLDPMGRETSRILYGPDQYALGPLLLASDRIYWIEYDRVLQKHLVVCRGLDGQSLWSALIGFKLGNDPDFKVGPNGELAVCSGKDFAILEPTGDWRWSKRVFSVASDHTLMSFDPGGNIVATSTEPTQSKTAAFAAKLDRNGSLLWQTYWTHSSFDQTFGDAVAVSSDGYVAMAGRYAPKGTKNKLDHPVFTVLLDPEGRFIWPDSGGVYLSGGALFDRGDSGSQTGVSVFLGPGLTVTTTCLGKTAENGRDMAVVQYGP